MASKKRSIPGLRWRNGIWHIEKQVCKVKLYESTGTACRQQAELLLAHRVEAVRQLVKFGALPDRLFSEAAIRYLDESSHLRSVVDSARHLKQLAPYIAHLPLSAVHADSLQPFISDRLADGRKRKTINLALQVVQRILNLAANTWRDELNRPWLQQATQLPLLDTSDSRPARPLSHGEVHRLLSALPDHLIAPTQFLLHTGCREQEVCQLQWAWERPLPELHTSAFVIPRERVKNREDRLVVLNRTALAMIERCRGNHPHAVFTYRGSPITKLNNTGWQRARERAGLKGVRIHDLKHTFGRRLRAAGISLETRKVLLGHKNGDITTHYSQPELKELLTAVRRLDVRPSDHPTEQPLSPQQLGFDLDRLRPE